LDQLLLWKILAAKNKRKTRINKEFGSLSYLNSNLVSAQSPGLQNADNTQTDTTAQGERQFDLKRSAHPVAAIFHILFKIAGILT